jgi:hypothetical protein
VAAVDDNADSGSGRTGLGTDGDGDVASADAADIGAGSADSRTSSKSLNSPAGDRAGSNRSPRKGDASAAGPRRGGGRRAGAGRGGQSRSAASRAEAAGDETPEGTAPDAGRQEPPASPAGAAPGMPADGNADEANADGDAAGQTAHHPGPLALAASAARVAAEARIRAAAQQTSPSAVERPPAGVSVEADPASLPAGDYATVPDIVVPGADVQAYDEDQASAASGDTSEVAGPDSGDIGAVWAGPGFATGDDGEPEAVRFWPWSQPADYAEGDPEPGPSAAEPQDRPQASHARRNRLARGYSIPRLSRAKRTGPVPGP